MFIVLHVPEAPKSRLPEILNRRGRLRASHAIHGETIEPGRIYVAPSDNHMTLSNGHVHVVRGPQENGHRPAVDPLFRTAAASYGKRVIGVVLTGALDCGTGGLLAVHARGGLAIVQRPEEAACPSMPASALAAVPSARALPLAEIGPALARLAGEPVAETSKAQEAGMSEPHQAPPFALTCPSCHGAVSETEENGFAGYRCHVGHTFTLRAMISHQAEALEAALWAALRALKECKMMTEDLGRRLTPELGARFDEKSKAMQQHADVILRVLLSGDLLSATDGELGDDNARDLPAQR